MTDADYADLMVNVLSDKRTYSFASMQSIDTSRRRLLIARHFGIETDLDTGVQPADFRSWANSLTAELKRLAVAKLPTTHRDLARYEVRLVENWALNAQVLINPHTGNPLILLNAGIMGILQLAFNIYFALTYRKELVECSFLTNDDIKVEFFQVISVALHGHNAAGGSESHVAKLGVLRDPLFTIGLTTIGEVFLLLHEYAHIALGHVPAVDLAARREACDGPPQLHTFKRTTQQELEADCWAIDCLSGAQDDQEPFDTDIVLFVYGFLMLFLETCYRMDNDNEEQILFKYPEHVYRWEAIKDIMCIENYPSNPVWGLDPWFSRLVRFGVQRGFINPNVTHKNTAAPSSESLE